MQKNKNKIAGNFLTHVIIGLAHLLVLFPFYWQLAMGRFFGSLLFHKKKIRHVILINLRLCFPEMSEHARIQLCKNNLKSLGMALIESINAWYLSERRFKKIKFVYRNGEIFNKYKNTHSSAFILCGHFHAMELVARDLLSSCHMQALYHRCKDPVFERSILRHRKKYYPCIERARLKEAIKILKNDGRLVFIPDQNRDNSKNSDIASFFGVPCSITNSIEKIPKITNVPVLFISLYRDFEKQEYHCNIQEITEEMTPTLFNQLLEQAIRQYPAQYLWTHRRFDARKPNEVGSLYFLP